MSTTTVTTAEELLRLPRGEKRYELIRGELIVMSPGSWQHGMIIGEIEYWITRFVKENSLGRVFGAETGFILERDPDTVRAPDVAVLLNESLRGKPPESAYWPGTPDLAVEALSPTDTAKGVREKTADWLAGGAKAVWIVDGDRRTITIHEPGQSPKTFQENETLEGGDVMPGFSLKVSEVFEGLE